MCLTKFPLNFDTFPHTLHRYSFSPQLPRGSRTSSTYSVSLDPRDPEVFLASGKGGGGGSLAGPRLFTTFRKEKMLKMWAREGSLVDDDEDEDYQSIHPHSQSKKSFKPPCLTFSCFLCLENFPFSKAWYMSTVAETQNQSDKFVGKLKWV